MKVFITKYALTKGIYSEEVEVCSGVDGNEFVKSNKSYAYFHKPDYHENINDAISKAKEMKDKKIKSLEMQLRKLNKLVFSIENTIK